MNLAAVDIVFPMSHPDPKPHVLEINYSFGRRGLGGSEVFYGLLFEAVQEWLLENGLDPGEVTLA
jgi:ribosomal protein S6--L-glutamate ligase